MAEMSGLLPILIPIVLIAVLAVLGIGVIGMLRGGEFNRKYGNRLMRLRVLLQFVAVALLAAAFFIGSR